MTTVAYDGTASVRDALARYFDDNGFGPGGGYEAAWVDVKLGPIPFPFPNTEPRRRAVRYHDIHHVLTGYATDIQGEFEISAWEIAAGCKGFVVAWLLNLSGIAGGLFTSPRRTFRAFVRGRRSASVYGRDYAALLERSVGALRGEVGLERADAPGASSSATASDVALFALAASAGAAIGSAMIVCLAPAAPIGWLALRRARASAA